MAVGLPIGMDLPLSPTIEPLTTDGEVRAALDRIAAAKFRYVQLSATQPGMRPRELDRSARRDLLATLRRRELGVSGLDAWIPPRHFLDPAHVDRAIASIRQAIELAAELERCPVSFTLPAVKESEPDPTVPIVQELANHAERFGVKLADHAVPASAHEIASLGIGIDPAAWLSRGEDPAAAVLANGRRIVSARLCDLLTSGLRGPIGDPQEGQLDVLKYKTALSVVGYARPVIIDARAWAEAWEGLNRTRARWTAATE